MFEVIYLCRVVGQSVVFFNPNAKWSRCGNAMKGKMRGARAPGWEGAGWAGELTTFGS